MERREWLLARIGEYGFRPLRSEADLHPLTIAKAIRAISTGLGSTDYALSDTDREEVFVNADLVFMPHHCVGTFGLLLARRTQRLWSLTSAVPLGEQIWGLYKGVRPEGSEKMTIDTIHDKPMAIKLLQEMFTREFVAQLTPLLDHPPVIIEDVDVYWYLRTLHRAEEENVFAFHVDGKPDFG